MHPSLPSKTACDFSGDWKDLIHLLLFASSHQNQLELASKWMARKFLQKNMEACKKGEGTTENVDLQMNWEDLLADLQQKIPLVDENSILFKHRIFLLPKRLQADVLFLIKEYEWNIDKNAFDEFCSFLANHFEETDDWIKRITIDCFIKNRKAVQQDCRNDIKVKFPSRFSLRFEERIKGLIKLADKNQNDIFDAEISSDRPYEVFREKHTKSNSVTSPSLQASELRNVPQHILVEQERQIEVSKCTLDSCTVLHLETVVDEPKPPKRQKIENELVNNENQSDPCSDIDVKLNKSTSKEVENSIEKASETYISILHSAGMFSSIMNLKDLIEKGVDFELTCKELNEIVSFSLEDDHIDVLCDLLCLKSLNESSIIFFLKCCSSDQINFGVSVLKKFLSNSIFHFLAGNESSISRKIFVSLMEISQKSKEGVIFAVLLPLMVKTGNNNQQEFLLKYLVNNSSLLQEDYVKILDHYILVVDQENAAISDNSIKYLETLLEKKLPISSNTMSNLVSLFERNLEELHKSSRFVKLVILLTKCYRPNIANFRDRLVLMMEQNTSFLKKTAVMSLKKVGQE